MLRFMREREGAQGVLLVMPTMFWLVVFLLIPLVLIVVISFATRG